MPRHAAPEKPAFPSRRELRASLRSAEVSTHPTQGAVLLPPLLPQVDLDDPRPASEVAERPAIQMSRPKRRVFAASAASVGVVSLLLTVSLPGIRFGESEQAAAALQAQLLNTGGTADSSASFDALNSVSVEAGDGSDSFVNYVDARVQFPFAHSVPLTDPFGERQYPVAGFHDAQDFAAPDGTTIQSIADGVVLEAGLANDGCGFGLKVEHEIEGLDVTARYCHMQVGSHDYQIGDTVRVGDPVGRVGNTGMSFGSHLHFALTVDKEAIDPMPFLLKYNRLTRGASQKM